MNRRIAVVFVVVWLALAGRAWAELPLQFSSCAAPDAGGFEVTITNTGSTPAHYGMMINLWLINEFADGPVYDFGALAAGESTTLKLTDDYAGVWYLVERVPDGWRFDGETYDLFPYYDAAGNLLNACPATSEVLPSEPVMPMVRFTQDTELLWGPSADAHTGAHVRGGQTARAVAQQDGYTRIAWAGQALWIVSSDGEFWR